jgi:hypothetical protein
MKRMNKKLMQEQVESKTAATAGEATATAGEESSLQVQIFALSEVPKLHTYVPRFIC